MFKTFVSLLSGHTSYIATPSTAFLLSYTLVTLRRKCTSMGTLCLLENQQIHNTVTGHTSKGTADTTIRPPAGPLTKYSSIPGRGKIFISS